MAHKRDHPWQNATNSGFNSLAWTASGGYRCFPTSQISTTLLILLTNKFNLGDRQLGKSERELELCFWISASTDLLRGLDGMCRRKVIIFLMKLFPVKDIKRYQEFTVMGHLARGKRNKMDLHLCLRNHACCYFLLRQEGKGRWAEHTAAKISKPLFSMNVHASPPLLSVHRLRPGRVSEVAQKKI